MTESPAPSPLAQKPSPNREKLLAAARRLMADKGYAGTGTEEIVRGAGVTRGALYYQFVDKRDLFRALCECLTREIAGRIYEGTMRPGMNEADELAVGAALLLDLYGEPEIRQILLLDGPAVLGWEAWRAMQQPVSLGLLTHALEHLVEAGRITSDQIGPLAQMLFGALCQAGIAIANASDPAAERIRYRANLAALLGGIGATARA